MALIDMVNQLGPKIGVIADNSAKKLEIVDRINIAASTLYRRFDVPGCMREQFVFIDTTQKFITLPWQFDRIDGVRWSQSGQRVQQVDQRPRYHKTPWRQPVLQWRQHGIVALMRSQVQAGPLVVQLAAAETKQFTVTITGQTTTSTRATETLTFTPGTTLLTTTNSWQAPDPMGIISIIKSAITINDLTVFEGWDTGFTNPIAQIPNFMTESRNQLAQTVDYLNQIIWSQGENILEVLYKLPYIPMVSDTDTFSDTRLEEAIIWKARQNYYSEQVTTTADQAQAMAIQTAYAENRSVELMRDICKNIEDTLDKRLEVEPNQYHNLYVSPLYYPRWPYRPLTY